MNARFLNTRPKRVLVIALALLAYASATLKSLPVGAANAQEGEGETIELDMASWYEPKHGTPGSVGFFWQDFTSDPHCDPLVQAATEFAFVAYFDLEAGTVSGSLSGIAGDALVPYSERIPTSTFEGYIIDGWVRPSFYSDTSWEFGGTVMVDATLQGEVGCRDRATDEHWRVMDTRSVRIEAHLDGQIRPPDFTYDIGRTDTGYAQGPPDFSVETFRVLGPDTAAGGYTPLPAEFPLPPTVADIDDRDDDGVPDGEDLCPDEAAQADDGCPEFDVRLGCQPPAPTAGEQVTCSAKVIGAHEDETFEYRWYLDYAFVKATQGPSWTWGEAEPGPHDIGVQVTGEGRSADADVTLEVGEEKEAVEPVASATEGEKPSPPEEEPAPPPGETEPQEPVHPTTEPEKPAPPPTIDDLVRDLEEFLAGKGVKGPTPGQAAAAGGISATLLGAWAVSQLLSGVSMEDLLKAVSEWRRGRRAHAPEVKPVPEVKKVPTEEVRKPPPTWQRQMERKGLATATMRAIAEALERRLGRPPTRDEIAAEIRSGCMPHRKDIVAQFRKWAEETEAARTDLPKGWASRLADGADALLDKILPPTIQVYNPWTGKMTAVPNPDLVTQAARILLSGMVDSLRFGEGFAEALRILEPKKRTFGEAAWDWIRASWHVTTDVLRGTSLAKGVKGVTKGITSLVKPKPKLPVIRGPLPPRSSMPPSGADGTGRIGASLRINLMGKGSGAGRIRRSARLNLLRQGAGRQISSEACVIEVETNIVNDLKGRNYKPQRVFFQSSQIEELGFRRATKPGAMGGGFADYKAIPQRFRAWGLKAKHVGWRDVSVDEIRKHLNRPGTAVEALVRRPDGSGHTFRVLGVEGSRPSVDTIVRVWDPEGGGTLRKLNWFEFLEKLEGSKHRLEHVFLISK